MGYQSAQPSSLVWALAAKQHGVVARSQLIALGLQPHAIKHRLATGRLHPIRRGVYAVGRPELSRHGRWMAAVLSCGPEAVLSHESAAALWEIRTAEPATIEVSVPGRLTPRQRGIRVHRRGGLAVEHVTHREGVPVTTLVLTLVDLATRLRPTELEAVINEADKRDLADPESVRAALKDLRGRPGVARLRKLLDRRTFRLTDSELERRFLALARRTGLPVPRTRQYVSGFRVDFHWPDLGLVVETDGLRYHRTPAQQARDRLRDQAHTAAGLTPLRFTHAQVRFEPEYVQSTLEAVSARLSP